MVTSADTPVAKDIAKSPRCDPSRGQVVGPGASCHTLYGKTSLVNIAAKLKKR
jgi:hypothetical protein